MRKILITATTSLIIFSSFSFANAQFTGTGVDVSNNVNQTPSPTTVTVTPSPTVTTQTPAPTVTTPTPSPTITTPTPSSNQTVTIQNPLNSSYSSIPLIIGALLNIIIQVALVACGLYIIYAGFLYVKAQGNPQALSDANKTMLHAVIGTAIILSSDVILTVMKSFIGSITTK